MLSLEAYKLVMNILIVYIIKQLVLKVYHPTSSISLPGNLLKMQILKPHPNY